MEQYAEPHLYGINPLLANGGRQSMGYYHILHIRHEPILRALDSNPCERDDIAVEIGQAVLDLTVHDSHEQGPLGPASLPFRDTADVICSTGSLHDTDNSYFVWTGERLVYHGLEKDLTDSQIDELSLLNTLGSLGSVVEQLDDEQSHYAIQAINADEKTMADYEIPNSIASIYQIWEDKTWNFLKNDTARPHREVGLGILKTLTSILTPEIRLLGGMVEKRVTIIRPEYCVFHWTGRLMPAERDS